MTRIPEIRRVRAEDLKLKMLVYGHPGAGKTVLAATANDHAALAPALFLNFEGGLLSVSGRGDIDAIDITSIDQLEEVHKQLVGRRPPFDQYRTVIIDSASEMYNLSLQEAVDDRVKSRGGSLDFVDRGDYGTAGYQVKRIFRNFRDLPLTVIATAHAKETYPRVTPPGVEPEPTEVVPLFPDKLSTQMRGMFDFVHYLFVYEEETPSEEEGGEPTIIRKRGLLTQDRGAYKAKTRGMHFPELLGDFVENPTLPAIYDLLLSAEGQGGGDAIGTYLGEESASVDVALGIAHEQPVIDDEVETNVEDDVELEAPAPSPVRATPFGRVAKIKKEGPIVDEKAAV